MHEKLVDRAKQKMRLCDSTGKETGEIAERWQCHKTPGKKHLAFLVFVINDKKQFALHKRSVSKVGDSLLDSPVSHILVGETLKQAVHRCLKHEYGIAKKLPVENYGGFPYEKYYGDGTCENEYCLVLSVQYSGEIVSNPNETEGGIVYMPLGKVISVSKSSPEKFEVWFNSAILIFEKSEAAKGLLC